MADLTPNNAATNRRGHDATPNFDVQSGAPLHDAQERSVVGTQSVFRALSILQAFTTSQPAVSGIEIAARFGYSIPTAHRLLRALEAANFLVFDRATHRYSPGPEILRLSGVIFARDQVVRLTTSTLERLRDVTGETAGFHWVMGNQRTCVQEMAGPSPWSVDSRIGTTYPLTRGAAGKAILLGLGESGTQKVLEDPEVVPPPRGLEALLAELGEARQHGYTRSFGENEPGVTSIAVPFVWLNLSVAAFSVTGPQERFDEHRVRETGLVLLAETEHLRVALSSGRA
jgi:DNA-binding IclR family transcriptional regulator